MAAVTQAAAAPCHPFFDFNDAADSIVPRHDKAEIRSRLLDQLESVLVYLFPRGKRRGSQFYIGNLQGDPGDSLVIELDGPKRGVWIDFATGESGDVFDLWAAARGIHLPVGFCELLEDVGHWLLVPQVVAASSTKSAVVYDELGPYRQMGLLQRRWPTTGLCLPLRHACRQAVPPVGCPDACHAHARAAPTLQPAGHRCV